MDVIRELTDEQRRRIPDFREKWKTITLATGPVDCERVESALNALFHEIELKPPEQFLLFPSPAAAWSEFSAWFPRIGRCLVAIWSYQLPLFDPRSFWRKFGENRGTIDLAVRRRGSAGCAWTMRSPLNDVPGTTLDPGINREIWAAFDKLVDCDWAWRTVRYVATRFPEEHDQLRETADREDPSNPVDVAEYVYLGPFDWLIQELACVDFCQGVLGSRTNTALYGSLTELIRSGSLVLTFERLCLVCERPAALSERPVQVRYGDGYCVT